ncbi:hypothetical protein N0V93_009234 [Gnomoniopsis smithogilvyi]|uniref:Uncharacterized protein n=1 Tax=Gnomoniopsis smithogilvyi TaxID=1191159 RepID=A0A9W9CTL5_9PEZI|nr:hypothetical protein N0V93_009234 [Gnomoniopsis smithogilvyi]
MPQLPISRPAERRPSYKWIWLSLLGLILLCGAAIHRRQLPLQRSKDLSGYKFIYLSPAAESLEQVPHLNNDDDDDDGDYGDDGEYSNDVEEEEEEEELLLLDEDPIEIDSSRLRRKRIGRGIPSVVGTAQYQ